MSSRFSLRRLFSSFRASFVSRQIGKPGTFQHRVFIEPEAPAQQPAKVAPPAKPFSPWHDIPLHSNGLYNMINEIPRLTRAKYELATKEPFTPIKQDVKKGELRYFKYGEMPFNYGALPQTWEDCNEKHPLTGYVGDNDPIDAVELSDEPIEVGKVVRVRVLGIFALIDEGETDWKLIVIQESHPLFDKIHSIADVEKYIGGETIKKVRDWFQYYKTADGKAENQFAMNGDILDAKMAEKIIEETHHSWQKLVKKLVRNESGLWVPSNVQQQSAL